MEMIRYLSIVLSEEINLSRAASGGLIRLAIKEEVGPYKPIEQLTLNDYLSICQNSLGKRLQRLGIAETSQIITYIKQEIIKNQSLATMEKV